MPRQCFFATLCIVIKEEYPLSKKVWIIFAVACVALLAGLILLQKKDKADLSNVQPSSINKASEQSGNIADHVFGKADSKVVLIEYGDYQCPGCGKAYPIVKAVSEKYKNQIAFVFRNFPLSTLHPNAKAAAAAAEAAGLQGKYWEMHDTLYMNQSAWENLSPDQRTDAFADYAKGFNLDAAQLKKDLASTKVNKKITFDQAVGKKAGVSATPTFYLNGTVLTQETWGSESAFDDAVAKELKAQTIPLPEDSTKK